MTQRSAPAEAPDRPTATVGVRTDGTPSRTRARTPSVGRMVGLDLARGLAVFGMYTAHVGPDPSEGGFGNRLFMLAHGRSSALFAVLAGVTMVIIAGRPTAKTGRAGRQAIVKVVIRSIVLFALGTALTMMGTPVDVILSNFGLYFLLALPFVRLRARALAVVAICWVLAGPQLLYLVLRAVNSTRFLATTSGSWPLAGGEGSMTDSAGLDQAPAAMYDSGWARTVAANDPLANLGVEGVLELLFTGAYPALSWMPFLLAGMALGRLDLASAAIRIRLAVLGPALAMIGYGGSWLAFQIFPGIAKAAGGPNAWWFGADNLSPASQLVAAPHSQTTLSVIGSTGVAITVIVAAVILTDRFKRVRRLAAPVIAVGSMSLSAYVFHIVGIAILGDEENWPPLLILLGFIASVTVLAFTWKRYLRWGPLEYLVSSATRLAHLIR
jgi:uncharacterized membrane protein YeiB